MDGGRHHGLAALAEDAQGFLAAERDGARGDDGRRVLEE
jgi:hypothetical protein